MHFTTSIALAVLLGLTSAAPATILTPEVPPSPPAFNLLYEWDGTTRVSERFAAPKTGTWYIGSRYVGSDDNQAVLLPSQDKASLLYAYGASSSIATASTGITITPGGTATVPDGKPIELVNNNATTNVKITEDSTLWHQVDGRFQACFFSNSDQMYLSYVAPGQRFLADCQQVKLIAECSWTGVDQELVGQLGAPSAVACKY